MYKSFSIIHSLKYTHNFPINQLQQRFANEQKSEEEEKKLLLSEFCIIKYLNAKKEKKHF